MNQSPTTPVPTAEPAPHTPPVTDPGTGTATYVFALTRDCDPGYLSAVAGHAAGGPVRLLRVADSLEAVVQDVPAADFSQEALERRLSDRTELERCVRAHHAVVVASAQAAPTLPLPLATLYLGDARARAALAEDEPRLRAALARVTGREEWAVKVYAVRSGQPADSGPSQRAGSGRAYLDRLRGRQRAREQRHEGALRAAESAHTALLREHAVAARRLRTHGAEVTGSHRTQVMNGAYLVSSDRASEVAATVERLRNELPGEDVEIELSGPWVPYSFVDGAGEPDGNAETVA
jgi:hypothetical protein